MIEFENKYRLKSSGSNNGEWLTHPAFTFGDSELSGIWVGKFTTSVDSSTCYTSPSEANCNKKTLNPRIKPNLDMWRYTQVSTIFSVTKQIETNNMYGLNSYDNAVSHLGSILMSLPFKSLYGNDNYDSDNKQLYTNNYRQSSSPYKTLTGCSSGTPTASQNQTSCPHPYPSLTLEATGASTTGNIYGVYDMRGGAFEYTMGQLAQEGTDIGTFYSSPSSGSWDTIPELKYYDSYEYDASGSTYGRGRLGDATRETLKIFGTSTTEEWYGAFSSFPGTTKVWFLRGGGASNGSSAGAFAFGGGTGGPGSVYGFRVVLILE